MILLRIFEDEAMRAALAAFFDEQSARERATAADFMGDDRPDPELARKHACYAKAYEEAMNRLRAYTQV